MNILYLYTKAFDTIWYVYINECTLVMDNNRIFYAYSYPDDSRQHEPES